MSVGCSSPRVVHLVPRDGLGGVEAAVRSLRAEEHLDLAVFYISGPAIRTVPSWLFRALSPTRSLHSPIAFFAALREVLRARPDALVCSLWRSTMIGIIAKALRPRLKLVVMVHGTTFRHVPDRLVTALGSRVATAVWCDSEATKQFAQRSLGRSAKVISFLVGANLSVDSKGPRGAWDFVYWGRHVQIKDVPRAVRLFNRILVIRPEARLFIYGQEGSATESIREAIGEAADPKSIRLMGAKPPGEYPEPIPSCTFFLMTSRQEGMAVAVVEAMQLGLIPVVTPAGEIANYCNSGQNAVIVTDDDRAALDVVQVASNAEVRMSMGAAAMKQWIGKKDYSSDFKMSYEALLDPRRSSMKDKGDG